MKEKDNVISLRDASITTMTISIRVMQVGQKQMTLAVLKQLSREAIIDTSGEQFKLHGVPWGLVNYAHDMAGHQLVWQLGDELRRSPCGPSGEVLWPYGYQRPIHGEESHWYREIMKFWTPFYENLTQLFVAV